MNQLEAMQIFVRVAELASYTRAAESLGMPKASMSTAVQQLESEFGTQLLHRTTRKVQTTLDGRACYERCKDLLADMDELRSMFQQGPQELRGRLRVDMPTGIARTMVIPQLPEFMREHLVREGFDCVMRVGSVDDLSLIARPLGAFSVTNCASAEYVRTHGMPRTVEDLAHHQLIHYVGTFGAKSMGFEYHDGVAYRTVDMPGAITVNSAEAYQESCLAGLGIIQVPGPGMRKFIEQGLIVEVAPELRAEPMPVWLLYAQRRNLSRRVQVFMTWIADLMKPYLLPLPV
jgi:DNA-binding transcriptional LysR family regulator